MTSVQPIIFTDMDGSLLDHDTYSHADADEMLDRLRNKQIPVIPCTSKTRSEVQVLRAEINNAHPFIVENGAAVCIPDGYFSVHDSSLQEMHSLRVKCFSQSREHWQAILKNTPMHLNDAFVTFEQAGIEGIMQMTGLALNEARLASQREFGEPLKWLGSEQQYLEFERYIKSQHGNLLKGGRFIHVSGDSNKGVALDWLLKKYQQEFNDNNIVSVALGDSQNDVAMLSHADYAVVIRSPVHYFPQFESKINQNIYQTQFEGPKGWSEGVRYVLKELGVQK